MTIILDNYKLFENKADLNEAVRLHLVANKYELNATAIKTLEVISRHAVKHGGAAWLKIDTLAGLIGKSAPTARRAVALLECLGIVERIAYMRPKSGGNGGNIIRILVIDCPEVIDRQESEKPCGASVEQPNEPKETINLKSYKSIKELNTYNKPSSPYKPFKSLVTAFIGDGYNRLINRLYGVWIAQTSYLKSSFDADDLLQTGLFAVKATFQATKRKSIRNLVGYYNGVLDRMLDRLYLEGKHAMEDDLS
ncbi:helix-turn-helix domain-containing protein [Bacillus sp. FJAT-52991]|uniref:Helix-turn-helix domain-containing protein n=1 Tax=Bacillus kandeliae TaxID=3129297 RepID=A0ABZ2N8W0_9BACI